MSMRKIYRTIAKKYGVSPSEVRRDMDAAIAEAWNSDDSIIRAWQRHVPHRGEIPSAAEVISYAAKKVSEKTKE